MIYIILPLISAIFVLLIALIVISRGYSRLNTIFSLFCLATFIWLFGTFMMFISKTDDRAIFWDRFIYIGVVFMPTISYHFGAELIRITRRRLLIYASYFLSAVFLILSRTELFISGINRYSWGVHSQAKFFHHLFLINFIFLVSLLFYDLYIFYKKSKNSIEKNQIRYIFIALFILSLGSFSFLPAYGINIFPVFYLSGVFFTIILAYAIIKYRVFDIRQVISRGILYFILLIFVSLSFTFVTFSTAQFFEGQGQIWVTLLVSLIIVTGLDPLKRLLAKWTDAFFYKGKIDFQKVLRDISEIISSELDLEKLIFSLETNISHKIKVKHSEILIARTNANNLIFSNVNGSRIIQAEDNIADYLFRNKKMIITEELFREKTDLKTEPEKAEIDKLLEQLDNQAIGLVVPILAENKITAIVGTSGSGKTTLIKLLLAFYKPNKGSIKVDDTPIADLNPHLWRQKSGAVMQDGFIFSDSIANNIAIGEDIINKEHLQSAVQTANIKDFIESLPLKYNTKIGMEGNGISQGQRQRLLIARAVYKNPTFLFFDEATNSLDANNEKIIMDNLSGFYKGKTVVIVAHRLSTVQNADNIIVLDKGKIIEEGTHKELTEKKGAYYTLVKNQLELGR